MTHVRNRIGADDIVMLFLKYDPYINKLQFLLMPTLGLSQGYVKVWTFSETKPIFGKASGKNKSAN